MYNNDEVQLFVLKFKETNYRHGPYVAVDEDGKPVPTHHIQKAKLWREHIYAMDYASMFEALIEQQIHVVRITVGS